MQKYIIRCVTETIFKFLETQQRRKLDKELNICADQIDEYRSCGLLNQNRVK